MKIILSYSAELILTVFSQSSQKCTLYNIISYAYTSIQLPDNMQIRVLNHKCFITIALSVKKKKKKIIYIVFKKIVIRSIINNGQTV